MRVAVIGAGSIGGFLAAALARSGLDVAVVARGAHLDAIARDGITLVSSDFGPFSARVAASDDLAKLGSFDVLILTFKSHQWPALLEQLAPFAHTATRVVTMQNGVPFWFVRTPPLRTVDPQGRIGALFDDAQVIGGVVHVSGHIVRPGCIHQSGGTRYVLGTTDGRPDAGLDALVAAMRGAGLQAELDTDVREKVWLKLVNNVGLNTVSTLRELTIQAMLSNPQTRGEVRELMLEALAVGQALGVVREADVDARLTYAQRLGDVRTSMLQDALAGRPLELDPIVGAVVELAARLELPVPRLAAVYATLRERYGSPS